MDFIFSLLSSIPYLPYILLAVILVVVYNQIAVRLRISTPGMPAVTFDDVLGKMLGPSYAEGKLNRAVQKFKKQGDYLAAGKLLEDAKRPAEAAEAYVEGQELHAAAATYEKLGKLERAAELYLQDGDHKKAGQVLVDAGKPGKAATLFLEKGNNLDAARLFGIAGQWDKAGDIYAKGGYPLRAAESYEKKGDWVKAAECYEKHFMENVSYSTSYSSTAPSADQKSALSAGKLYEKAGDLGRALQIYSRGSYFRDAAQTCVKMGQFAQAAELFLRAEDPAQAADAFEKSGDAVRAANLRGEVALKQEKLADAAAFFRTGQDYQRAAELFESIGMLAEAAGAFEAAESWAAAGGVYIRAGNKERAAVSYERANDFETAAKLFEESGNMVRAVSLYEKAGLTFKAGEAAAQAGQVDRAIPLLQKVPPADDNYRTASEILARLFIESGRATLAIQRLQNVLGGQPVSAANLDLYYWLAAAHEKANPREALALFRKIQAEAMNYRDVDDRLTRLEMGKPVPPAAAPRPASVAGAATPPATAAVPRAPSAPVAAPSAPATKGPRFVPKEEIGRGRLGTLHRAEDQLDGRNVALRVLPDAALKGEGVLAGLAADLKQAAALSHPNGVKLLGFIDRDGQRCVVTEYVQGRSLSEALRSGQKIPVQQAHALGRVMAQYLAFVHGKGLVHGSIQPSNVMVASGVIKIADLGLGRLAHGLPADPDYRAPENELDVAGDLYAMAAVLYHLLTGVHPKTQPQGSGLPLPSTFTPGVPEALDKLLLRCLHPRADLRLSSAEQILDELKVMVRLA